MPRRTPAEATARAARTKSAPAAVPRARGALARLRGDERGSVAIMTAIGATSLLGMAGLAVEVGGWYVLKRNMQAAVDAASMAAAVNIDTSRSASAAEAVARSVTSRNGFVHGQRDTTVSVEAEAVGSRVSVVVERPATSGLLRAAGVGDATRTVRARATARIVDAGAPPCVLTLQASVAVGNNTDINASGCALASNSSSADAFKVGSGGSVANGSGRITTANIVTHGGCTGCAEALGSKLNLTRSPTATNYAPKLVNSYASLDSWSPPSSVVSNLVCVAMPTVAKGVSSLTLFPGCYDSISVKSNNPVDLKPGVYYIRGGDLSVQGTLTCSECKGGLGVSLLLVGKGGAAAGKVDINSQASVTLNAGRQLLQPAFDGVLIYRHAPGAVASQNGKGEIDINGGANLRLNGAVVAPTSWVTMGGNAATGPDTCTVFISHSMSFSGTSNLSVEGCDMYGTKTGVPRMPRLVE